jgi:SNF2 family DNA or RNA helicase
MSTYTDLIQSKVHFEHAYGFDVNADDIHPALFPHQRAIVAWAAAGGRRGIFASFGLGKTLIALELMRLTLNHQGGRALIVCPLGVRQEFAHDAERILGMPRPTFIRRTDELAGDGLYLTNYESVRDGRLDTTSFDAVTLDEAAILRNYGTVTSQTFHAAFAHCTYRYCATATPSPNEYRELFEYAHFLGIMDRGQAMTRFTKRDSTKANHLTLLDNMADEFWHWVASWSVWLTNPIQLCPTHKEAA